MIVPIMPAHCGECGRIVEYKRVNDAPHGQIFACMNYECPCFGHWYKVPELKALRYFPIPKLLTKQA